MSVGIAVICDEGKHIVLVSDEKMTYGAGQLSADNASFKHDPFVASWVALYAGDDALHARPVLERAREEFYREPRPTPYPTAAQVGAAVSDAYTKQLQIAIQRRVLSRYGLTAESFVDHGRRKLAPSLYNQLCARIERETLSLIFLLCGFVEGEAHIVGVDGDSAPCSYDEVGFAVIGAGEQAAFGAIAFHMGQGDFQPYHESIESAVYCALEAKFMAETAPTVGHSTFVCVLGEHDEPKYMMPDGIDKIRRLWLKRGAPRVPASAETVVKSALFEFGDESEGDGGE